MASTAALYASCTSWECCHSELAASAAVLASSAALMRDTPTATKSKRTTPTRSMPTINLVSHPRTMLPLSRLLLVIASSSPEMSAARSIGLSRSAQAGLARPESPHQEATQLGDLRDVQSLCGRQEHRATDQRADHAGDECGLHAETEPRGQQPGGGVRRDGRGESCEGEPRVRAADVALRRSDPPTEQGGEDQRADGIAEREADGETDDLRPRRQHEVEHDVGGDVDRGDGDVDQERRARVAHRQPRAQLDLES